MNPGHVKISKEIINCLEYILETEAEDFEENPSKHHVFYSAYKARYGKASANLRLDAALEN